MRRTTRTTIIVETREVWLLRGAWPQGRCARCGGPVEVIGDQDPAAGLDPDGKPGGTEAARPGLIEPAPRRLTCLRSLLKWF